MRNQTRPESEIHKRALALIEDPFETVYEDVVCRSFRNHEIEIIDTKMGDESHTLTIYVADGAGVVNYRAYSWEDEKGEIAVRSKPLGVQAALEILRKYQVLDDLASV